MDQLDSKTVYAGAVISMAEKRYRRADGSVVERQVVEHPGSVAILAHDDELVYLVRQPREALEDDGLIEVPAGTLDAGESELECAQRELAEEVGLRAERWTELMMLYPAPGFSDERQTLFHATELSEGAADADEDEQIEVVEVPLNRIEAALDGVHDATTLVALLWLRLRLAVP